MKILDYLNALLRYVTSNKWNAGFSLRCKSFVTKFSCAKINTDCSLSFSALTVGFKVPKSKIGNFLVFSLYFILRCQPTLMYPFDSALNTPIIPLESYPFQDVWLISLSASCPVLNSHFCKLKVFPENIRFDLSTNVCQKLFIMLCISWNVTFSYP